MEKKWVLYPLKAEFDEDGKIVSSECPDLFRVQLASDAGFSFTTMEEVEFYLELIRNEILPKKG